MDKNRLIVIISRIALIAAIVVFGVFAIFGLIKMAPKALSSLASAGTSLRSAFFLSPKETLKLNLSNNSINTGEETTVAFDSIKSTNEGSYVFRFDCDGKDLSMTIIEGANRKQLPCNATTTLASNSFTLIPNLKNQNSFIDSNLYVDFIKNLETKSSLSGKTVLTVHNGSLNSTVPTAQTGATQTSTTTTYTASSSVKEKSVQTTVVPIVRKADLNISMKDAGIFIGNNYNIRTNFRTNESPSVRFDIGNNGNTPTGPWQFIAILPTNPGQVFSSGIQPSLRPGEVIEYTLTLANLASIGPNVISIHVDNMNVIRESSETNNVGTLTLIKEN